MTRQGSRRGEEEDPQIRKPVPNPPRDLGGYAGHDRSAELGPEGVPKAPRGTGSEAILLDCGGTTPLLLHVPLMPDPVEFTPAFWWPIVQGKRGYVPHAG